MLSAESKRHFRWRNGSSTFVSVCTRAHWQQCGQLWWTNTFTVSLVLMHHSYFTSAQLLFIYFSVLNSFSLFYRCVDFISILPDHLENDGLYIVNCSHLLQFAMTIIYLLGLKYTLLHPAWCKRTIVQIPFLPLKPFPKRKN